MIRLFYISAPSDSPGFYQTSLETDSRETAEAFISLYEQMKGLDFDRSRLSDLSVSRFETCGSGGYPILGFERLSSSPLIEDR